MSKIAQQIVGQLMLEWQASGKMPIPECDLLNVRSFAEEAVQRAIATEREGCAEPSEYTVRVNSRFGPCQREMV